MFGIFDGLQNCMQGYNMHLNHFEPSDKKVKMSGDWNITDSAPRRKSVKNTGWHVSINNDASAQRAETHSRNSEWLITKNVRTKQGSSHERNIGWEETSQETSTRMTRSRARQNPGEAIGFQSETFNVTRFQCRACDKSYAYQSGLSAHEKSVHGPVLIRFECPTCRQSCSTAYNLRIHFQRNHGGEIADHEMIKVETKNPLGF